jgi:autotransporter-associated beta strand protein
MRRSRSRHLALVAAAASAVGAIPTASTASVTLTQSSNTAWTISNGNVTVVFNPSADDVTSVQLGSGASASPNLVSELDEEFAGTPFGAGNQTFNSQIGPNKSYADVWTTTASTGNSTNPITYSFHYLIFANDPTVYCYEVLNHSATDPATSVGQGQFLFRSNSSLFPNLYQTNTGPNQLGTSKAVTTLNVPSTNGNWTTVSAVTGRQVQNAVTDLTGSGIAGDNGTNFFTKYDYSTYTQFFQAETMYGGKYAVTEVDPSIDTLSGGPTKQELAYTDPGILNMEFLSDHYGMDGTFTPSAEDPGYAYTPTQGVATTRLFGPFGFTVTSSTSATAATINQNAINAIASDQAEFNTDAELAASGYVSTASRGSIQINAGNPAGWSSNTANNTVVLSEPGVNFQESTQGYQYWGQLSQSGNVSISNVVPGTYRLSMYELGQWGETRVEGVQVGANGAVDIPPNLKFTPENFGTAAPIWTLGTPNRSANEFLNGHNSSGADQREYQGSYDYWGEEQTLGNPGKVVYYATAVGSTAATNNPNAWIANQWGKFDPGEFDSSNNSSDNYANVAPSYVTAAGGPATYSGSPWEIHFTTTAAQDAQGQYVVLSVGLAASEASLVVELNGHQEIWHYNGAEVSDPAVRSGDAGFYQFLAFQFPTSDLLAAGDNDEFTFSVSQPNGVMYDAMRMEITNTSASPSVTGWNDYYYITGANSQVSDNDAAFNYQILTWSGNGATGGGNGTWDVNTTSSWSNGTSAVVWSDNTTAGRDSAVFGGAAGTVSLSTAASAGCVQFTTPGYTLSGNGTITLGSGGIDATQLSNGTTAINTAIALAAAQSWNIGNGTTLSAGGSISGAFALTKTGSGTLALNGVNIYSGGTIVSAGTLLANSSDTLNGSTGSGLVTVASGATLGGTGQIRGSIIMDGTITAGNASTSGAPGKLTANNAASITTLAGGGAYDVKINNATGTGGTNWDELVLSGLSVTASSASPFTIELYALNISDLAGAVSNFNKAVGDTWTIARISGITRTALSSDLAAGDFALNTANFTDNNPLSSTGGHFSLDAVTDGTGADLQIMYSATPEPGSALLCLCAVTPALSTRCRRPRRPPRWSSRR